MTMSDAPMASGAMAARSGLFTVMPTVKTRKNVPMNSTTYLAMGITFSSQGFSNSRMRSSQQVATPWWDSENMPPPLDLRRRNNSRLYAVDPGGQAPEHPWSGQSYIPARWD